MLIYIIMIALICLNAYIFRKNKKYFCISTGIILWIPIALRHISIGLTDTEEVYLPLFDMILDMNFIDIFNYRFMSDKLFFIIMKIISFFTSNYQICIAILGIPMITFVMYIIYKYSEKPLLSVIVFLSLYYAYAYFLLRQVIALGIICLSIKYIERRKLAKFLIMVGIASLFHKTALIFVIAYPFCRFWKFGLRNYILIAVSFITARFLPNIILQLVQQVDFTGRIVSGIQDSIYTVGEGVSISGLLITVCILIASHLYYKKMREKNEKIDMLFNLSTLGSIVFCFSSVIAEFYRVSLYFSIFNILLLPNAIACEKNRRYLILFDSIIILGFVIYFLMRTINNTGINPYIFFWG